MKRKSAIFFWAVVLLLANSSAYAVEMGSGSRNIFGASTTLNDATLNEQSKSPFVLGAEDIVEISVWGNEGMTTLMPVRPDGTISFPLIGDLKAKGLTPAQLKDQITKSLRKYITDASVTVIVKEIKSINISIAGEVNEPGTYNVNRPITLLHLFSIVKGFTEKANLKKSYVLRGNQKLDVDLYALVEKDDFSQNIWLNPDDLIYIHDNFDNRINIMGEVNKPQVITFKEGMTVMDAVLIAEGLTEIARPTETKVYRRFNGRGQKDDVRKLQVELDKVIFEGDLTKNLKLKPGDIIHIPRSFF